MSKFQQFCTSCSECGGSTSKSFARANGGRCKSCVSGVDQHRGLKCPTCGEYTLTSYQKAHGYHCDGCTRNADPVGWANEVRGFYD